MKSLVIGLLSFILVSLQAFAEYKIIEIGSGQVSIVAKDLKLGELVEFKDKNSQNKAVGKVKSISIDGTALVEIQKGSVQSNYKAYKKSSAVTSSILNTKQQSQNQPLTEEDYRILQDGEISGARHALGGVLSVYPGLGVGQAVQGRYSSVGWKFTVAEIGFASLMISGISNCDSLFFGSGCTTNSAFGIGLAGLMVTRIWEIVDAISGPSRHNNRYRYLKSRQSSRVRVLPMIDPQTEQAGLQFSYSF
jgi:hypothetical protein